MRVRSKICAWLGLPVRPKPRHFELKRRTTGGRRLLSQHAQCRREPVGFATMVFAPAEDGGGGDSGRERPNGVDFQFRFSVACWPGLRMLSATNPMRRVVGRAYDGVRGVRDGPRAATPARDQLGPNSPRLGGYHAWRWRLDAARARRSGPEMGTGRRCR